MKKIGEIIGLLIIISIFQGCHSGNKSKEVAGYQYKGASMKLNEKLETKIGSWVKEGMECYGVAIMSDKEGNVKVAKEIKSKVVEIQNDKIKMKALETVSLAPKVGCNKIGVTQGEIWWEEDGELFRTREEAIAFIKTKLVPLKKNNTGRVTVDGK